MLEKLVLALLLTALGLSGCAENDDDDELDPFDMLNFDHANMKMKKSVHVELKTEAKREQEGGTTDVEVNQSQEKDDRETKSVVADDKNSSDKRAEHCPGLALFKQFVSVLLIFVRDKVAETAKGTATEMCLHLSLTPKQIEKLESFKSDSSIGQEFDAHEVLIDAIKRAHVLDADDPLVRMTWLEERFGITLQKATMIAVLAAVFVNLAVQLSKLQFTWNMIRWIIFLIFVSSVSMTWYRLYKGEVAKQHEAMMKDLPQGCTKLDEGEAHSSLNKLVGVFKYYFTFQKDECIAYYEHLLVDPIVKISPMEAVAVALVQTVLKPLRTVGSEFSVFFRALLKDLPVQYQLAALIFTFIFLALILLLSCGYRFHVPFLLAIEPGHISRHIVAAPNREILPPGRGVEGIGSMGNQQINPQLPPPQLQLQSLEETEMYALEPSSSQQLNSEVHPTISSHERQAQRLQQQQTFGHSVSFDERWQFPANTVRSVSAPVRKSQQFPVDTVRSVSAPVPKSVKHLSGQKGRAQNHTDILQPESLQQVEMSCDEIERSTDAYAIDNGSTGDSSAGTQSSMLYTSPPSPGPVMCEEDVQSQMQNDMTVSS